MAFISANNVAIRGIAACVPKNVEENLYLKFYKTKEEAQQVIDATGIERRHVSPKEITASDLCLTAAEKLIEELGWEKESIDLLAFATQCPDYINQPNSFGIHEQLGLPESTMCLDFYHGCPAWVVSLSSISSMMQSGFIKRAIFLDGDTASKEQDPTSREEKPLFGDAGTATAIEYDTNASPLLFNIGTKSEDGMAIARRIGGFREPYTLESYKKELERKAGLLQKGESETKMDSMDVFSFAITKVPKSIKKLCSEFDINSEDVDYLLLHQANKLIVENIAKRMKVEMNKVPLSLKNFGNTTSASIPLTIVSECADSMRNSRVRSLACGFGTGLAWGALYFETENLICPPIIEL